MFADNLPGYPDGMCVGSNGRFWVTVFAKRTTFMDLIHPYPFLKSLVSKLPSSLYPVPKPQGYVVALDSNGKIVENLQDLSGEYVASISDCEERDGDLYLGSLISPWISVYKYF